MFVADPSLACIVMICFQTRCLCYDVLFRFYMTFYFVSRAVDDLLQDENDYLIQREDGDGTEEPGDGPHEPTPMHDAPGISS